MENSTEIIYEKVDTTTKVPYHSLEQMRKENNTDYKRIVWTEEDSRGEFNKQNPNKTFGKKIKIQIPEGVKELEKNCFHYCRGLSEIIIPETVDVIDKNCFKELYGL